MIASTARQSFPTFWCHQRLFFCLHTVSAVESQDVLFDMAGIQLEYAWVVSKHVQGIATGAFTGSSTAWRTDLGHTIHTCKEDVETLKRGIKIIYIFLVALKLVQQAAFVLILQSPKFPDVPPLGTNRWITSCLCRGQVVICPLCIACKHLKGVNPSTCRKDDSDIW